MDSVIIKNKINSNPFPNALQPYNKIEFEVFECILLEYSIWELSIFL